MLPLPKEYYRHMEDQSYDLVYFILQPDLSGLSIDDKIGGRDYFEDIEVNFINESGEEDVEWGGYDFKNTLGNLWGTPWNQQSWEKPNRITGFAKHKRHLEHLKTLFDVEHEDVFPEGGWKYLVKNSYVKIGKSTPKNTEILEAEENEAAVYSRFTGCPTGNPNPLFSLGYMWGSEKYWHYLFEKHKVRGEWYALEPLMDVLKHANLTPLHTGRKMIDLKDLDAAVLKEESLRNELISLRKHGSDNFARPESLDRYFWTSAGFKGDTWEENEPLLQNFISMLFVPRFYATGYGVTEGARLTRKAQRDMFDIFGDKIKVYDYYYRLRPDLYEAYGISIRNAVRLYGEVHSSINKVAELEKEKWEAKEKEIMHEAFEKMKGIL
tara:strand:+ start:1586 stop:2728 length:1143 start_codon:yes stop_codon:yes gene_type:complete